MGSDSLLKAGLSEEALCEAYLATVESAIESLKKKELVSRR